MVYIQKTHTVCKALPLTAWFNSCWEFRNAMGGRGCDRPSERVLPLMPIMDAPCPGR